MEAAPAARTVAQLLADAARRLRARDIATPRLDAEVLLAWALGVDRAALYARSHDALAPAPAARMADALERRCRREPLAYITGVQEFWSLPFAVSAAVLIPRPETELVVQIAVEKGDSPSSRRKFRCAPVSGKGTVPLSICDVGTGCGCIAIALARERPGARLTALDTSADALAIAARNAVAHGVADRIELIGSDLFAALTAPAAFDVIVSNPPYLAPGDAVSPELAFEPAAALAAGADGLAVIRRLIAAAPARLRPGGWLVVEIGYRHADAVLALARAAGFRHSAVEPDLAGIPRVLKAQRP